jgi:cephalosporin hydroxylase
MLETIYIKFSNSRKNRWKIFKVHGETVRNFDAAIQIVRAMAKQDDRWGYGVHLFSNTDYKGIPTDRTPKNIWDSQWDNN